MCQDEITLGDRGATMGMDMDHPPVVLPTIAV